MPIVPSAALAAVFVSSLSIQGAGTAQEQLSRKPMAVVHGGDGELIEKLKRVGEVWFDAGPFLVGALGERDMNALRGREVELYPLLGIAPSDELFVVDLNDEHVREDVAASARIEFARDGLALVSVPHGLPEYPESLRPGRTCHSGHTAIARTPMKPLAPLSVASSAPSALLAADPRIQSLVDQVTKANLQSWVQSYTTYTNRDSQNLTNYNAGKSQLVAQLQSYGYSPVSENWSASHGTNIVVDIPGAVTPNRYVVIGAHFDTRNYSGGTAAVGRGADDNTSGSSAVLEIARILASSSTTFANSVRLVWFSGEEYGLLGSGANANNMLAQGKQVVGMLNMDMIAYRASTDVRDCDFATNNTSPALTAFCQQTAPLYVANWAATSGNLSAGSSDHASYNSVGIPAAFFFEDLTQYFSQIHTSSDAFPTSTTDFDLAQMICKGVLACGATLADPVDLTITHTELPDTTDALGPYVVQADVQSLYASTVSNVSLKYRVRGAATWSSTAMVSTGGVGWRGLLPAQGSPRVIEYYIEALDNLGAVEVAPKGSDTGGTPYDFFVGTRTVLYSTGFEEATDNGWTHAQAATQDDWQRGVLYGKAGDPATAFAGTRVWGNDLGPTGFNGSYANNVNNYLRSPAINCSGAQQVFLEFRRWLTVESSQYDQARIRVNGTQVWINPNTADLIDTAWVPFQLDISSLAANNPTVQIEFSLQSDGGVAFGGWNLDEFALVTLGPGNSTCPSPSVYCTAKTNSQGCVPQIAASGSAGVSGTAPFTITGANVINQRSGLLFYGFASGSTIFQGGTKCIGGTPKRSPLVDSGGNVGPDDCSGVLSFDFNARIRAGVDPALFAGNTVYAQWWYRDGADPQGFGTGLSNAVSFRICP